LNERTTTRRPYRLRGRFAGILASAAILAVSTGLVVLTAPAASAHTPGGSGNCTGVTATASSYDSRDTNRVKVTIDGTVVENSTFASSFHKTYPYTQNTSSHVWEVAITTTNVNPNYSKTYAQTVTGCAVQVTPVTPTAVQSANCGVQGSYTIPDTASVQYLLDGQDVAPGTYDGPASGTVTAVATGNNTMSNPSWSFQLNLTSAQACPQVTALSPEVTDSAHCGVQGSYTIPDTAGVQYLLDGQDVAAGTYDGPASGTVTAVATGDNVLTNPDWSMALNLAGQQACPQVTALSPEVTDSAHCGVQGSYTIPDTAGVQYLLDGQDVAAGTYDGPASGTVTAVATGDDLLTNPDFSFALDLPAAADCPNGVTPAAPEFTDPTCKHMDGAGVSYPATEAVAYSLSGDLSPGGTVTVKAVPNPGFSFPDNAVVEWVHTYPTVESLRCATVAPSQAARPKPSHKPTVKGTQAAVPTAVEAGLAGTTSSSSTGSSLPSLALVGGGVLLLAGTCWFGLGRRRRSVHEI
jgi:hypothetical protein